MAAAFFAVVGCNKSETPDAGPVEEKDEILVSPQTAVVDNAGRNVQVVVSSSGEWSLSTKDEAQFDWVTVDKKSGVDGDVVTFAVSSNDGDERVAEFVFACGEAMASFKVTSLAGELPTISLVTEPEVTVGFEAGKFEVTVSYELLNKEDIKVTIPESCAEWLTHEATIEGELVNSAKLVFNYSKHNELTPREATVSIFAEKANPVEVKVKQLAEPVLKVSQSSYKLGAEAGSLEVTVETNVEYEITYAEGSDWLTGHKTEGKVEKWSYGALSEAGKREAQIIFTEKNPVGGAAPLTATVLVKQSNSIISTAAYMKDHCAGTEEWKTPSVLNLGKTFTIELLVKHDLNFSPAYGWSGTQIGTLFGIERRILIRHGDNRSNVKEWELVYVQNSTDFYGDYQEVKLASSKELPADEWAHIAVVFDEASATVKLYQNGEEVGSAAMHSNMKPVDLTETYSNNSVMQRFYLGRSYDSNRDFEGMMSEVRVWNKALSSEELNAKNHFYTVPANSDGLVAYWKLNDGSGTTFKDYTANGNDLECRYKNWYEAHADWRDVDIP